jgi:aspartate aminotransferase
MSPNLALDHLVAQRQAAGASLVHLGFGEARLPVLPAIVQRLAAGSARSSYGPVAGAPSVRSAVAGYFDRRRLPTDAEQTIVAPGSKPLLMALQLAVPGDVVLPRPCWNSYLPQAQLAGKGVIPVPIPRACGGIPDPDLLPGALRAARAAGLNPRILIVTVPDNPTGTVAPADLVGRVCAIAEAEDLIVVSDEIYRDLVHDPATPMVSPAEFAPARTVVTTGLSKSLALGGWRIGAARFPAGVLGERVRDDVVAVASDVWSTLAVPMQEVATYAFSEPADVRARLVASARLHGTVAAAVHRTVVAAGARCRPPSGGFYVYPDLEPRRVALASRGITDSASLQQYLLHELGIAVLAGHLLGDEPQALRFKAATSLLYGDTREEQQAALDADDPLALPQVAEPLARIERAFTALCGS